MIELSRSTRQTTPSIRIIGIGGAGANVLDRLILDGIEPAAGIAMNTDVQALNGSVARSKVQLGVNATRGLGAGGDPEIGYASAEEATDEITAMLSGTDMVFICAGLGGGTGAGATPLVAHVARKAGAFVIAFVTLPFTFEGKRRCTHAAAALRQIEAQADLVIVFENDRMGEATAPNAGIQHAFAAADHTLSQSIRAIATLVQQPGFLSVGLDDLIGMLRKRDARCLFGYGESDGPNRAHEALERALRSPLLDRGRLLGDARHVLIHVTGGAELTLNEVGTLMGEFNRHVSDTTRIHFGVGIDPKLGPRICVAILSSEDAGESATTSTPVTPVTRTKSSAAPLPVEPIPSGNELFAQADLEAPDPDALDDPDAGSVATPTRAVPKYAPKPTSTKKVERAEQMPLEPASRGRFEKSEPTIVDGEDLDVPTFLRKNIKVK